MNKIKSGIAAVVGGVKDYAKENKAVHKEALDTVSAEQKRKIATLTASAGNSGDTPMGGNQVYDAASELAKRIKTERGITIGNSIRNRMK